jgi:hypothetical protein
MEYGRVAMFSSRGPISIDPKYVNHLRYLQCTMKIRNTKQGIYTYCRWIDLLPPPPVVYLGRACSVHATWIEERLRVKEGG